MGFRFRRTFQILPGIKVNLGKEGFSSMSFGRRGAKVTVGKNGTRQTVGLPGSGISYTNYQKHEKQNPAPVPAPAAMDNRASLRCPHCNAITKRGVQFCGECGFDLTAQIAADDKPKNRGLLLLALVIWFAVFIAAPPLGLIIAAAWGIYVYKTNK